MRLFRLEVKRIMKSRRTLILFTVALLMSIVMAYLPISFESINQPGENGEVIELDGIPAIQFKKDYYEKTAGEITPQKLAEALRTYQSYVKEYGTLDDVPLDIYIENIMAIRPMLKGLTEAFADSKTGMAADLMDINPDEVEQSFYEKCASHLNDIMNLEQKGHSAAARFSATKYSNVNKPFLLYSGMSRDAFDYITLYIFILSILCIAIAAPIFANEYQTGSDSILRCTKYGRMKLASDYTDFDSLLYFYSNFCFGNGYPLIYYKPCIWNGMPENLFSNVVFNHKPTKYNFRTAPDYFSVGRASFCISKR